MSTQPSISQYEMQRALRVAQNKKKMEQMGLLAAAQGLSACVGAPCVVLEPGSELQPRLKRQRVQQQAAAAADPGAPTRLSRRLRGVTALDAAAAEAEALAEVAGEERARRGATRRRLALEPGVQLAAPFTLWSIGVTVWELGAVHRGAWAHRYWSSPGCLYHHAYPVGYRATKAQFGRTYEMRIEEGPTGPVFKVIDTQTGAAFAGASPTKPWTDVCLAHRTGQRISGPLFFGFSDPLTQRAIAANLYTGQELRAALHGGKVEQTAAAPEELAAREFCGVDGVGEATAIALARSTALGGSRHAGLDSLRAWASASDANAQALFAFLTSSEEMAEGTRRWPAWRQRLAPKVVLALSGRWLGSGPLPAPGDEGEGRAQSMQAGSGATGEAGDEGEGRAQSMRAGSGATGEAGDEGEGRAQSMRAGSGVTGEAGGGTPPADAAGQASKGRSNGCLPRSALARDAAAAPSQAPAAKENLQLQQNRAHLPAAGGLSPTAACHRGSRRERRANSKWAADFLMEGS